MDGDNPKTIREVLIIDRFGFIIIVIAIIVHSRYFCESNNFSNVKSSTLVRIEANLKTAAGH